MSDRLDELNGYIASLSVDERAKHEAKLNDKTIFDLIKQGDAVGVAIALQNGLDLSTQNDQGMNPLHVAAENGTELISEVLINEVSSAPFQRDDQGRLPLDVAREAKHEQVGDLIEKVTYAEQFKGLERDQLLDGYSRQEKTNTEPAILQDMSQRERFMRFRESDHDIDMPDR